MAAKKKIAQLEKCPTGIPRRHHPGRIATGTILVNPKLAAGDQIFAVQTLVRRLPPPMAFSAASFADKNQTYTLRLYVAGLTPRSQEAIRPISAICQEELKGQCDLEVIDIYQNPVLAKGDQIIAVLTLVRLLQIPLCKIIGNLADKEKILVGLDLRSK